jgi:hypothetical protein
MDGRREAQCPPTLQGPAARGRRKLELAGLEGRHNEWDGLPALRPAAPWEVVTGPQAPAMGHVIVTE